MKYALVFLFMAATLNVCSQQRRPQIKTFDIAGGIRCGNDATASIIITASNGNSGNLYYYSIDSGITYQASRTFANLMAGTYILIVKDTFKVTSLPTTVTIKGPAKLILSCSGSMSCGDASGTASVTVSGGNVPYQYSWERITDGQLVGNAASVSGLSAGTYRVRVVDSSQCMDTCNVSLIQQGSSNVPKYKVGDLISCGYVVYVDTTVNPNYPCSTHYLICALSDQSNSVTWFNTMFKYQQTNATTDILFDRDNALRIDSFSAAANVCSQYSVDSCSNWYLPSKAELQVIYATLAKNGVGGFAHEGYWSSVEGSKKRAAWIVDFYDGRMIQNDKSNQYRVRAVCEVWLKNGQGNQ